MDANVWEGLRGGGPMLVDMLDYHGVVELTKVSTFYLLTTNV